MNLTIDPEKCRCRETKLCISVCPYDFIWTLNEKNVPQLNPGLGYYCIACGHCESICPTGAVKVKSLDNPPLRVDKKARIPTDQAALLLKTRRSVRRFKKAPVPRNELEELLDIARWIPTASNKQQLKWIVINGHSHIQKIARLTIDFIRHAEISKEIPEQFEKGNDIILRHAPHLMVVLGEKDNFWRHAEAGIALTYLELYASAKKFGACWAGYFTRAASQYQPLIDFLNLPDGYTVCGGIMIGHPEFRLHSIPFRKALDVEWR